MNEKNEKTRAKKGRAMTMNSRVKPHEDTLRLIPGKLAVLLMERSSKLRDIATDERFTDEHRRQASEEINRRALEEVRSIRQSAVLARAALQEIASEMASSQPQGSAEELLRETRIGRSWSRYRDLLEAGTEPFQVIRRAEEGRDEAAVAALVEEMPSYLEARGWNPAHLAGISEALARAEEPYLSEEQVFSRKLEGRLSSGWSNLEVALAHAGGELDGTFSYTPTTALPAYEGGLVGVEDLTAKAMEAG